VAPARRKRLLKAILALILVSLVALATFYSPLFQTNGVENRQIPVGTVLYEWYGFNMTSTKWTGGLGTSHWNASYIGTNGREEVYPTTIVKDEPDIGFYASDNNATLAWQLSNMKQAGISVIVVSWWGMGNDTTNQNAATLDRAIDNATLNVFRYVESTRSLWNFKLAIMVEPFNYVNSTHPTFMSVTDWTNLLNYIQNTFYGPFNDITFYWQGKPLLLSYNPQVIPAVPAASVFTTRIEGNDYTLVNWVFWEGGNYNDSGTAEIGDYEYSPRISPDGEVGVAWRYDDYYLWNGTAGPGGRPGYMRFDVNGTQRLLSYEMNFTVTYRSDINFILLYSWNEYHERSAFEPHQDMNAGNFNADTRLANWVKTLEATPDIAVGPPGARTTTCTHLPHSTLGQIC
jgi:hypothetical protein